MTLALDWPTLNNTTVNDAVVPPLDERPWWDRVVFRRCDFRQSNLAKLEAFDCAFEDCDFRGVSMVKAEFYGCRFERCAMSGADTTFAAFIDGAEFVATELGADQVARLSGPIETTRMVF